MPPYFKKTVGVCLNEVIIDKLVGEPGIEPFDYAQGERLLQRHSQHHTCTEFTEVSESRESNPGRMLPKHVYYHYTTLRLCSGPRKQYPRHSGRECYPPQHTIRAQLFDAVDSIKLAEQRIEFSVKRVDYLGIAVEFSNQGACLWTGLPRCDFSFNGLKENVQVAVVANHA